jgi:CheY-like chemotaxis protein
MISVHGVLQRAGPFLVGNQVAVADVLAAHDGSLAARRASSSRPASLTPGAPLCHPLGLEVRILPARERLDLLRDAHPAPVVAAHGAELSVHLEVVDVCIGARVESGPHMAGRRILVVDDDAESLLALAALLRHWGCDVATAGSGEEALVAVAAAAPDVVIADLTLPAMDGCELARRLRALLRGDAILLVAFSGHTEPENVERAEAAGFDYYVAKPADPDKLRALIANDGGMQRPSEPSGVAVVAHRTHVPRRI